MAGLDLAALIGQEMDPKTLDLRARYENYRIAVDKAYAIASRMVPDALPKSVAMLARELRIYIEEDLNNGLLLLENKDADKAKLS